MRIVVALGGNALLERGQKPDATVQVANLARAVPALAALAEDHELVLTHGNGPQIGVLALQSASDPNLSAPYPFDVLGAQTQGMIGYWLQQAMQNRLPERQVISLVNQTLVRSDDPAFEDPTKFIGQVYDEARAHVLAEERGWRVKPDGNGWRRVVGSPHPQAVVETPLIRLLLANGAIVVCAGGGGVPVVRDEHGHLRGVEAVVDKDLTAAVLAEALDADVLLILTDVPAISRDFRGPSEAPILHATPGELQLEPLPPGSMGPKATAACRFVAATGGMAAIGRLDDARAMLAGDAGTIVTPDGTYRGPDDLRARARGTSQVPSASS